jgi:hypothetical protein
MLDHNNEDGLKKMLKEAYKPASASSEFKERLRKHLIDTAGSQPRPQPLWLRPLVWAPVAIALAIGLIAYFVILPLMSPTKTMSGTLEIWVTDAPGEVSSVNVTVSQVQVHSAGDSDNVDDEQSWITVIPDNRTFDLVALQLQDVKELLGDNELEAGHYTQIRLTLDNVTVDGSNAEIHLPSGILKLVGPFEIQADRTTSLTLDFDVHESLKQAGDNIIFDPVVHPIIGEPREEAASPQ